MEVRKGNLIIGLTGNKRGITTKVSLPTPWVKAWGITEKLEENNREIFIYESCGDIIISRQPKNLLELAQKELKYIIKKQGYIRDFLSDDNRIIENLAAEICKNDTELDIDDVQTELIKFCYENFKSVTDFSQYADDKIYFYNNKYKFENIGELEKFFEEMNNHESD